MIAAYVPLQLGVDIREATAPVDRLECRGLGVPAADLAHGGRTRGAKRAYGRGPKTKNQWVLVVLGIVASLAAIAAIVWELGPVKNMAGLGEDGTLALVGATVISAWTFLQVMFALHYAGVYFQAPQRRIPRRSPVSRDRSAGLDEFFYQGLHPRLHVRVFRRQRDHDADAADCRDSRGGRLLLQRDHPCADYQRRREPLLAGAFAGYRAAMTEPAEVSPRASATLPRGFADRDANDLAAAVSDDRRDRRGSTPSTGSRRSRRRSLNIPMRSASFCPIRIGQTRACSRSRTTTSNGMSLRYDLTAPLARYVAENYDRLPKPYRSYRAGWVVSQREARPRAIPPVHAVRTPTRSARRRQPLTLKSA